MIPERVRMRRVHEPCARAQGWTGKIGTRLEYHGEFSGVTFRTSDERSAATEMRADHKRLNALSLPYKPNIQSMGRWEITCPLAQNNRAWKHPLIFPSVPISGNHTDQYKSAWGFELMWTMTEILAARAQTFLVVPVPWSCAWPINNYRISLMSSPNLT